MKGYRTIIMNILMAIAAIGVIFGVEIDPNDMNKIATGMISGIGIVNLILRAITDTKMGEKE